MNKYIGVKILESAKLMTRKEYCDYRGWDIPENEDPNEEVYLVEYEVTEDNKSNHPDHKGYISMSPKDVFEAAYVRQQEFKRGQTFAKPHEIRVANEAEELSEKLEKLNAFQKGDVIETLPEREQLLLAAQSRAMSYYLSLLAERVEHFELAGAEPA